MIRRMPRTRQVGLWVLALVAVAAAAALAIALGGGGGGGDVVATVNGEDITQRELYEAMLANGGREVLEQLITERLVEQEARRRQVTVSEDEIRQELDSLKQQYGEDVLRALLERQGMTEEDLRHNIRINVLLEKLVASDVKVSDEDVRAYYDENRDQFVEPEQVRARHILVEDRETADRLLDRIRAGESFEELAKAHSKDEASAEKGGDLGWFGRGVMVAEFEDAAFGAEPGNVVGPVQTVHGFHLIEVLEKKPERQQPFEEVRDRIRETLTEQATQQKIEELLARLRAEAKIDNRLER